MMKVEINMNDALEILRLLNFVNLGGIRRAALDAARNVLGDAISKAK